MTEAAEVGPSDDHEEAPSGFDLFIDGFASKNLESRARNVAVFLALLLLLTVGGGAALLGGSFETAQEGRAPWPAEGVLKIPLQEGFAAHVTGRPELFRVDGGRREAMPYREFSLDDEGGKPVLVFTLAAAIRSDNAPAEISYRAVFQRQRYWHLLLEKSGDGEGD